MLGAAAILKEHCGEYFDLERESPYMLLIADVRKPDVVPSITHVDNTARVQTVTKEENDLFYDLIKAFQEITGVPCVLNTSFNDNGESIVETPIDAILCFFKTGMDYLVLGNHLLDIKRIPSKDDVQRVMENDRAAAIAARREEFLRRFFTRYDERERDHFISESNKMAEWHAKYRSKYELEKRVGEWVAAGTRILIVGERDHTEFLRRHINGFWNLLVVGFCDYGHGFEQDHPPGFPYPVVSSEEAAEKGYDAVLISSFEHNFSILPWLERWNAKPVFPIYDNASRSLMETIEGFPPFRPL